MAVTATSGHRHTPPGHPPTRTSARSGALQQHSSFPDSGFPLLLTSPPCEFLGPGPKAIAHFDAFIEPDSERIPGGGRGCQIGVGPAVDALSFVMEGEPSDCILRRLDDPDLALEVAWRKLEVGTPLSLWHNTGHREWACRFRIHADNTVSPIDWHTGIASDLVLGVKGGSMEVVLVRPDDTPRRLVFSFVDGQQLEAFRAQQRAAAAALQPLRSRAVGLCTRQTLRELHRNGFVHLPGLVPEVLVREALREANRQIGLSAAGVEQFRSKSFPRHSAVNDLFNRTVLAPLLQRLLGYPEAPRMWEGQWALRFPGDLCPGSRCDCPAAHYEDVRRQWHIDGCANTFLPGVTDHYGELHNFDALVGVLLSDVPRHMSGELCCYPGSHWALAECFGRAGKLDDLYRRGNDAFPVGAATDRLFPAPPVPCLGRAGDVYLVNHMTAHYVAPNASPDIRYAVYFRVKGPAFRHVRAHYPEGVLQPWLHWPAVRDAVGGQVTEEAGHRVGPADPWATASLMPHPQPPAAALAGESEVCTYDRNRALWHPVRQCRAHWATLKGFRVLDAAAAIDCLQQFCWFFSYWWGTRRSCEVRTEDVVLRSRDEFDQKIAAATALSHRRTPRVALPPAAGPRQLTLVVPTYVKTKRQAAQLRRLLRGCCDMRRTTAQFRLAKLIVVDDASPWDVSAIVAAVRCEVAEPSLCLCHERLPCNSGPAVARNRGIALSLAVPGLFGVLFLDTDCVPSESWLVEISCGLLRHAVGGNNSIVAGRTRALGRTPLDAYHDLRGTLNGRTLRESDRPGTAPLLYACTCNMAVPASVLRSGLRFDPEFPRPAYEDCDFCIRAVAEYACPIYFCEEAVVQHDFGAVPLRSLAVQSLFLGCVVALLSSASIAVALVILVGGVLWLFSIYTLLPLARQAFRYGQSEAIMVRKHPYYFAIWNGTHSIPNSL